MGEVCVCVRASNRLLFKHILFITIYIEMVESRVTRVKIIGQLSKLKGFNCVLAALTLNSIVAHSTQSPLSNKPCERGTLGSDSETSEPREIR